MRAHEAGALHGNDAAPTWLPYPADVNTLIDGLWSRGTARAADGAVEVAGVDVRRIAEEVGTPAFVLDEDDFRHRARAFRDAFGEAFRDHAGADVYYAGKAFLCGAVARWVEEAGWAWMCAPGESSPSRCAPGSPPSASPCTATTSPMPRSAAPSKPGWDAS